MAKKNDQYTSTKNHNTTINDQTVGDSEASETSEELTQLRAELELAQQQLQKARESELRAMADYHNLVRRTQDERVKMAKFAALTFVEKLLQPMDHLSMAKDQLKDPGLNMIYQQFVDALNEEGLEVIDPLGQEFDLNSMEVIDKQVVEDPKQVNKVIKVMSKGYKLHGEVVRHAKVAIGTAENK